MVGKGTGGLGWSGSGGIPIPAGIQQWLPLQVALGDVF